MKIHPNLGVGQIEFGMHPSQISMLIGKPDKFKIESDSGEIREYRRGNGFQLVFSKDEEALVEIGFSDNIAELSYHEILVFSSNPKIFLKEICDSDKDPYEAHGYLVFLNFGITLTGFYLENEEKTITLFKKGRWDSLLPKLKKIKYSSLY